MHVRDDRAHQFAEKLYPMILQSDQFIGEMDLDETPASINLPAYNIHDFISERTYQKLNAQLKKSYKIELGSIAHLHPLMIMSLLSTSVLESEHHISLDEHLWRYAVEHGKPASGLETYAAQLEILHAIPVAPLYKQLVDVSRKPSILKKSTTRGLNLYIQGRIHELYKLSKTSMQQLRKKVIYERNQHMVSVIEELDKSKQYFITVGTGHLSGKFGLIHLLKKIGFTIKPL